MKQVNHSLTAVQRGGCSPTARTERASRARLLSFLCRQHPAIRFGRGSTEPPARGYQPAASRERPTLRLSSCCSRWRWPRLPPCARRRRRWRARASEIFCLPTRGIASGKARVVCNSGDSGLSEAVMPLSVFGWRPCGRTTVFSLSSALYRCCLVPVYLASPSPAVLGSLWSPEFEGRERERERRWR